MRILGIDYGAKHIGLAISDGEGRIAVTKDVISNYNYPELKNILTEIIREESITECVVGLPINMQGNETEQTREVKKFIEWFEKNFTIKVHTIDERFTSISADDIPDKKARKKRNDARSAQILLQAYLDTHHG